MEGRYNAMQGEGWEAEEVVCLCVEGIVVSRGQPRTAARRHDG